MGFSAQAPKRYSNPTPLKTLKPSALKEAWVIVHKAHTDIPMLNPQKH